MDMIECAKCKTGKNIDDFWKDSSRLSGRREYCKTCANERRKLRKKPEFIEITLVDFKCTICEQTKPVCDFDKNKRTTKGFVSQCKQCRSFQNSERYKKNPEPRKAKAKEYYKNTDKDKINSYKRKHRKHKESTDLNYKLSRRLRNRLYYAIKKKNWKKDTHFSQYIGCNREELIYHLQSQFKEGMSWENYGKWEIDHRIALSLAKTPEELYSLCHYTNLQPLWKAENAEKSDKLDFSLYSVKEIPPSETHEFIKNNHYLKRIPSISWAFGLYCNKDLVGIVTFGIPSSKNVKSAVVGNKNIAVLELNRLWLKYNRKNEASYFVSRALKSLPKNTVVISFADSGENHFGYVYQATNFKYYGLTEKRIECASYSDPKMHSRAAFYAMKEDSTNPDFYKRERTRKHRYIYINGDKSLYSNILYSECPYPKKNNPL